MRRWSLILLALHLLLGVWVVAWGSVALAAPRGPAFLEGITPHAEHGVLERSFGVQPAGQDNDMAITLSEWPVDAPDLPEALAWCIGHGATLRHRRLDAHLLPTHWPSPLLQTLERPPRNT